MIFSYHLSSQLNSEEKNSIINLIVEVVFLPRDLLRMIDTISTSIKTYEFVKILPNLFFFNYIEPIKNLWEFHMFSHHTKNLIVNQTSWFCNSKQLSVYIISYTTYTTCVWYPEHGTTRIVQFTSFPARIRTVEINKQTSPRRASRVRRTWRAPSYTCRCTAARDPSSRARRPARVR